MIEKNIPMPDAKSKTGAMSSHYRKMAIGDSIFLPETDKRHKNMTGAATTATQGSCKFAQRKADGGMRIWRTA